MYRMMDSYLWRKNVLTDLSIINAIKNILVYL